jgi:tetratricopeptide (TPR) repeat protein
MATPDEIASATGIPKEIIEVFKGQLERGELSLFTGAGFSRAALATDGQPLPGRRELLSILWPIGFPGEDLDESSTLGDVFECAVQQSPRRVETELKRCLTVDAAALPDFYQTWFSMPWRRIYTLNIDDLDEAVGRQAKLPTPIRSLSALTDKGPVSGNDLLSVHLNGKLAEAPGVTFSPIQYAERLPGRDPWYPALARELVGQPFLFVGTVIDESPLWQHIELRGERPREGRELRPKSYLVTPSVPAARRRLLERLNIVHIQLDAEEFALFVLSELADAAGAGRAAIQRRSESYHPSALQSVSDLRARREPGLSLPQFLLGREPAWEDITSGFAVVRDFEEGWLDEPTFLEPRVLLVTGTAGSGKSTTVKRLALELQARGRNVQWLSPETDTGISGIHQVIRDAEPDVLVIDDVDFLGAQAGPFLVQVAKAMPDLLIVAAARSTRAERLKIGQSLDEIDHRTITVPLLEDRDIDKLIAALDRAGVQGRLKGRPVAEQRQVFAQHAGRQLLVAMIEATSGRSFDDRVDDECAQLSQEQALVYAIVALATRARAWLAKDEVLLAAGGQPVEQLAELDSLLRQHLIVEREAGKLWVRHRVIAERAVAFFRRERQIASAVEGLLFVMATKLTPAVPRHAREPLLAVRLLNHKFMIEEVGDLAQIRPIYERLQDLLAGDYHFWLQRGSLEVEVGDLALAENYLSQAKGLEPDDYRVQTEYAYMLLKRASRDTASGEPGWKERSEEAFGELRDAIAHRGRQDSYPFHVLGSQGLGFARRAPFTAAERASLLSDLLAQIKQGLQFHPDNAELRQLRDDLEREYLLQAVDDVPRDGS